ncbi:protein NONRESPONDING TO OXYLIPINS 2, mitochondrial isoform X2 [Tasmannia lanceolata]|uniref:protein NONRESPONDING TO OXYLIPINS 2, mitochondrial isoform X2 n=1 Tax=Tasmannia lanceolata TaxID=3420 RepID=UPI00406436E1
MASRYRSISKPALSLIKSSFKKPNTPISPILFPRPSPSFSRLPSEMGCVQSLLPFHSAVSSARLTSCLGIDTTRALSQGMICRANPGV